MKESSTAKRNRVTRSIAFEFSLTRGAESPERFFPLGYEGTLQCDGYGVYASVAKKRPGMALLGCWTPARRRAVDALKSGEGDKALRLVNEIDELYAIEREARARGYTAVQRGCYRYAKCRPVFRRLKARFEALKVTELPSSYLGDAARYSLNRWSELVRYAKPDFGHVNIDQTPWRATSAQRTSVLKTGCTSVTLKRGDAPR
jgi:transposase